jgi:hypothetical protein
VYRRRLGSFFVVATILTVVSLTLQLGDDRHARAWGATGLIDRSRGRAAGGDLSQFCDAYPSATLRFLTRKEMLAIKSVVDLVQLSSTSATLCKKIKDLT